MNTKKFDDLCKYGGIYGIFLIISGAISCFGLITIPIGIPIIFAGIRMRNAAEIAKKLRSDIESGKEITADTYEDILEQIGVYIKINTILTIVGFGLMLLYLMVIIILVIVGITSNSYLFY